MGGGRGEIVKVMRLVSRAGEGSLSRGGRGWGLGIFGDLESLTDDMYYLDLSSNSQRVAANGQTAAP